MIKFFTNIVCIDYPLKYIVTNPFQKSWLYLYLRMHGNSVKEVLIDTGVETLFMRHNLPDYPEHFIRDYIRFIELLNDWLAKKYKVYVVIPDIPVDYPGRDSLYPYNVHRTIEYIKYFLDNVVPKYDKITFIAPIQGKKDNIPSVLKTYTDYYELYKEFEMVALAPTCTTRKWKLLAEMILRFDHITKHKYHIFGAHIKTIQFIADKVKNMYSFDSSSYFWLNGRKTSGYQRTEVLKQFLKKLPPNIDF